MNALLKKYALPNFFPGPLGGLFFNRVECALPSDLFALHHFAHHQLHHGYLNSSFLQFQVFCHI